MADRKNKKSALEAAKEEPVEQVKEVVPLWFETGEKLGDDNIVFLQ